MSQIESENRWMKKEIEILRTSLSREKDISKNLSETIEELNEELIDQDKKIRRLKKHSRRWKRVKKVYCDGEASTIEVFDAIERGL